MQKRSALILHNNEIGWVAVQALLQERDRVLIIDSVSDRDAALRQASTHHIDLLFASNRLAGLSSHSALCELRTTYCHTTQILLFVNEAEPEELEDFSQLGLAACCSWDDLDTVETIDAALTALLTGSLVLGTHTVACGSLCGVRRIMNKAQKTVRLAPLDRQILRHLANGFTAKEIALAVSRAPHTVENRMLDLRSKLGVKNSAQLIHMAHQLRLLDPR